MELNDAISNIKPLNKNAMLEAEALQRDFIKPIGSLGELEKISIHLSGISGQVKNSTKRKAIFLFGSDHGIYDEGVSSSPQYFTSRLMLAYAKNKNAAINILAQQAGAELKLYDLGVKDLPTGIEGIRAEKFLPEGTRNFIDRRAMRTEIAKSVIEFGISLVESAKNEGIDIIGTGEVGMANTTPATACIMAALNSRDESWVGRGAGLNDNAFKVKKQVILKALKFHEENLHDNDPLNIISCVGGLDIAAITGVFIGGAVYRVPIIIDGLISVAGALLASLFAPSTKDFMLASHRSLEPAYNFAAKALGIEPALNLKMRLGEGTGCAIAMQLIDDALAIINNMGDFGELE